MPFLHMPNPPWSHIQLEWQMPDRRRWNERLAQKRNLVRHDGRGSGLSDRNVADYSVEAHVLDLEAVAERLGLQRFALLSSIAAAPIAITYAARHPEALSHLVLWCPWAPRGARHQAFRAMLLEGDWELFTEALAHAVFGWSTGEEAHRYAAHLRECTTPEAARAIYSELMEFDVAAVLSQVRSPTLILQRRQVALLPGVEVAKGLASEIPDARLTLMEGVSTLPWVGDMEAVLAAIDEFLGEVAPAQTLAKEDVHTILFTDIEGSTTITQRLGDAKAQEVLRAHNSIVRDALKACGGAEIKHTGDGIMASFPSASRALECAITMQRAVAAHTEEHVESPLRVRLGLNAGEPLAEEKDLFGTTVQLASCICDHAEPGQILVPIVVKELAAGKGFLFADRGDVALRGFEDLVNLYEVRWQA